VKTVRALGVSWRIGCGAAVVACLLAGAALAGPRQGWSLTGFGGVMTDNVWEEALQPWKVKPIASYLLGVGVGYERALGASNVTFGGELQAVGHFGRDHHLAFNLPAVLRYYPPHPWPRRLTSYAFGLGLSHALEVPQTEIDRDGASSRTLIYWMAELEFALPRPNTSLIFRLHHRSDAYGLFATDSGSNALVIGLRTRF
jgi:hypothetical protein